jgi:secondary thiamine-phosphate synthase enzyme
MRFEVSTQGRGDFIDLTEPVAAAVKRSGVKEGVATVFVSASTAAVTTMEFEKGLMSDLRALFERLAPAAGDYEHHQRWGDRNGAAHMLAAIIGPSVSVPVVDGVLNLGTWQQIVLIDLDEGPRSRQIEIAVCRSN